MSTQRFTLASKAILILSAAALLSAASGCSVANWMGSQEPGTVPRDGELVSVEGVGGDQVRFTFRFKSGPDPISADVASPEAAPVGSEQAAASRISSATFTDQLGNRFSTASQDIRRDQNVYFVTLTSGPVATDSYEVVCQGRVVVGGYLVKLTHSAYREMDGWRPEPRSFLFHVYTDAAEPASAASP